MRLAIRISLTVLALFVWWSFTNAIIGFASAPSDGALVLVAVAELWMAVAVLCAMWMLWKGEIECARQFFSER